MYVEATFGSNFARRDSSEMCFQSGFFGNHRGTELISSSIAELNPFFDVGFAGIELGLAGIELELIGLWLKSTSSSSRPSMSSQVLITESGEREIWSENWTGFKALAGGRLGLVGRSEP